MLQHGRVLNRTEAKGQPSWRNGSSGSSLHCHKGPNFYTSDSTDSSYGDMPTAFCGRSSGNYEKMTRQDYEDLEKSVLKYFDKKFYFSPPLYNWTLPDPSEMFVADRWKDESLQKLKDELNSVKSKLDFYDLQSWHKHTRAMNKAGEIQWKLRKEVDPELLTQAWCKFYENAMSFNLVPPAIVNTGCLNSVHLCEAPGAFITSLNHYLKLHNPGIDWNWLASTLNPYYEGNPLSCMINDDRFILHTLDKWNFGLDYTGDLMDIKNMLHLVQKAEEMGNVLLVTADGSIDCQENPGEQESIVSSLHYCEVVSALHVLTKGGSFLLKMFTMYEQETVCLMFLLCSSFTSVRVCKPATSKEGNSEVYVVCLEYRGREFMEPWLEVLREHYGPTIPDKAMFPRESIPPDFLDQLYECATMFKNFQTDVIETNIRVYQSGRTRAEDFKIKKLKYLIANHFMERYELKKLSESEEVVGKSKLKKTVTLNMDPRAEEGSFADRLKKSTLQPLQLLKVLKEEMDSMAFTWPFREDVQHLEFPPCVDGFKLEIGKPVKTIHSSKFSLGRLLRIRNQVCEIAKKDFHLSHSSQTNTQETPSLQNGIPCENRVESQHLDQESELSQKLRKKYPKSELTILNYKEKLWTSIEGANEEAEIHAFLDIMEAIDGMWRDDNLLLQGYPMLTQFNVGVVYMLCHLFNAVDFMKPIKQDFAVVFIKFRQWNPVMRKFLIEVDHTIERLRGEGGSRAVLSVIPVNKLCEHYSSPSKAEGDPSDQSYSMGDGDGSAKIPEDCDNIFYKCVTEVNHLCVKEQVTDIISNILEQHELSSM